VIVLPAAVTRDQLLAACRTLGITEPDAVQRVTLLPDRVVVDWIAAGPTRREFTSTVRVADPVTPNASR
jgi:hypothetical protein